MRRWLVGDSDRRASKWQPYEGETDCQVSGTESEEQASVEQETVTQRQVSEVKTARREQDKDSMAGERDEYREVGEQHRNRVMGGRDGQERRRRHGETETAKWPVSERDKDGDTGGTAIQAG